MSKRQDQPRASTPPAVRRLLWWMLLPLTFMVAGAVLYKLPATGTAWATASLWWSLGVPIICFAPVFVAIFAIATGQRRIKRAVRAAKGRACIKCVHDLSGLGESGTCPECGHRFDIAADQRRWARVNMYP